MGILTKFVCKRWKQLVYSYIRGCSVSISINVLILVGINLFYKKNA